MSGPPPLRARWMTTVHHAAVVKLVGSPAVAVSSALREHFNNGDECWPGKALLALLSGTSEATVKRGVRELERAGLLAVHRSRGRVSNRYVLRLDREAELREAAERVIAALRGHSEPVHSDPVNPLQRGHSEPVHSEPVHSEPPTGSHRPGNGVTVTPEPVHEPVHEPADDDSFRARTNVRAHATPVDNPPAAVRADGQGSIWLQPVEAPATPAEGSPSHPLAARAATVPRRRGGNAAGKPCHCGHLVKEHAGSRSGFACTLCDCRRYVAAPNPARRSPIAATGT